VSIFAEAKIYRQMIGVRGMGGSEFEDGLGKEKEQERGKRGRRVLK